MLAMTLTIENARKIWSLLDHGLSCGLGVAEPGKMCVEAAVCYALGLPHGDNPPCVGSAVRAHKIGLNDAKGWKSNHSRAEGLRDYAIAQLGSDTIDQAEFARRLAEKVVRVIVPMALRAIPQTPDVLAAIKRCEEDGSADAAAHATTATAAAARAAKSEAAYAAARAAAATAAAARAAKSEAAYAAAHAAAQASTYACADWAAAAAAFADDEEPLRRSAQLAVEVLREMNAPGIALLDAIKGA